MGRIPPDELERIKREVPVAELVKARGVELKTHGKDLIGLCPFHDDHEPSLVVTPGKNLWHCLGACRQGGSNIDWVMKAEGISFRHAAELLRSDFLKLSPSAAAATPAAPVSRSTVPKLPSILEAEADDRALLGQVVAYYHETLKESPEATQYMARRGLDSAEMAERFQLGFSNRTLGYRLPHKNRKEGWALRGRLEKLGIYRSSGHEHFTGSLVIPVFDEEGNVAEIYGRKITPKLRHGTPLHMYLSGPHRGVWNLEALKASQEIILCESLIDGLTFWCAGFRNVTAAYGTNGFTREHLEAFRKHGTKRVLIAYDRDEAGDKGAAAVAAKLKEAGIECFRILFPQGQDANEYAKREEHPRAGLDELIRNAEWMGNGASPRVRTALKIEGGNGAAAADAVEPQAIEFLSAAGGHGSEDRTPGPGVKAIDAPVQEAVLHDPAPSLPASDPAPPPSSPVPAPPQSDMPADVTEQEVVIRLDERRYRVRGLGKNLSYEVLKVNLLVSQGERFHVDTFDLYSSRHRGQFLKQAAEELRVKEDVLKQELCRVLRRLEQVQEDLIKKTLEPKETKMVLSDAERGAALELLKTPDLFGRILSDFEQCGIVGEETNKLTGYLAAVSRKLEQPLAVIVQSSSSAGKSALMDGVLAFVPEEQRVKYSAMTGQSLFYMEDTNLKHKVLALVEEEGAERAAYALKLLQSEGELRIASTGKDPQTGQLKTSEYQVEGPVAIFLTTTAIEVDEELLNRCMVLTVNEDREQTRAIHRLQREQETMEGLLSQAKRGDILKVHRDAQRLLRPVAVLNPYARYLTFLDDRTRTRRDHRKYLTLIRAIAFLHQYQREVRALSTNGKSVSYVTVTLEDIETANRLAHEVLGRSLDELPPQTRRLLERIHEMVRRACGQRRVDQADYRFWTKDIRAYTGWSQPTLKRHLQRLVDMEYLLVHRGGRGQNYVYELLYRGEGQERPRFLMGLLDVDALRRKLGAAGAAGTTESGSGKTGGGSGQRAGGSGQDHPRIGSGSPQDRVGCFS